jgi:hypothetical protein
MQATLNLVISGFSQPERINLSANGTGLSEVRESYDTGASNIITSFDVVTNKLEFVYIFCDRNITITTHDAEGVLVDTLAIVANNPIIYRRDPLFGVNPFSDDCSLIKVSNASGATANLRILALKDATPGA